MAKQKPVGFMVCPECGLEGAEIKTQKTGLLYRWCPDCNAQYFPRTEQASERLRARMMPAEGGAVAAPPRRSAAAFLMGR